MTSDVCIGAFVVCEKKAGTSMGKPYKGMNVSVSRWLFLFLLSLSLLLRSDVKVHAFVHLGRRVHVSGIARAKLQRSQNLWESHGHRLSQKAGDQCTETDVRREKQIPLCPTVTSRSCFIRSLSLLSMGLTMTKKSGIAAAGGLVKFPCVDGLGNTYHFMRAGQSLLEAEDILSTNPLFLTNREAALSDVGIEHIEETCRKLREEGVTPTVVRYSLAANSVDSANIVGKELKIGRDRLVPEFNFMDPRAVGQWDMLPLSYTEAAVWAMDVDEAGPSGTGGRPPANEDSTPHETLANQVTRLTNLLSVLETQLSGDTILLIFPDGTGPAVLMALIAGIPLNRVHELNFNPGEVRLDITMESALNMLPDDPPEYYKEILNRGREELKVLRTNPDDIVSVKDQKLESERKAIEEELARKAQAQEAERRAEQEAKQAERAARREAELKRSDELAATSKAGGGDNNLFIAAAIATVGLLGAATLLKRNDVQETSSANLSPSHDLDERALDNESLLELELDEVSGRIDLKDSGDNVASVPLKSSVLGGELNGSENASLLATDLSVDKGEKDPETSTDYIAVDKEVTAELYAGDVNGYRRAEEAMKTYMDQDDGGEAWIDMLSDMIKEDDEEEGDPQD